MASAIVVSMSSFSAVASWKPSTSMVVPRVGADADGLDAHARRRPRQQRRPARRPGRRCSRRRRTARSSPTASSRGRSAARVGSSGRVTGLPTIADSAARIACPSDVPPPGFSRLIAAIASSWSSVGAWVVSACCAEDHHADVDRVGLRLRRTRSRPAARRRAGSARGRWRSCCWTRRRPASPCPDARGTVDRRPPAGPAPTSSTGSASEEAARTAGAGVGAGAAARPAARRPRQRGRAVRRVQQRRTPTTAATVSDARHHEHERIGERSPPSRRPIAAPCR